MGFLSSLLVIVLGLWSSSNAMQLHPLKKIESAESYLSPQNRRVLLESRRAILLAQVSNDPSSIPTIIEEIKNTAASIKKLDEQIKQQENERKKIKDLSNLFPGERREIYLVNRERGNSSDSSSDDEKKTGLDV